MNILVTGGAGFIGSHIVEHHLKNQDMVHVLDDLSTGTQENINLFKNHPNFTFTHADILTVPNIEQLVCWADRIYHMAAVVGVLRVLSDEEHLLSVNITATERLLKAAICSKRNPRILLASTSEAYGEGSSRQLKEDSNFIISQRRSGCMAYEISKIALEAFGRAYYQKFGLKVTILRIFNTIGPRQRGYYGMVVPRFVEYAINDEPIIVFGNGEQTRSFADVRDVIMLIDKIASAPETVGEILNVGRDEEISINDLALLVKELAQSTSIIKHISYQEAYERDFEEIMVRKPDLTKVRKLTSYNYQWNLQKTLINLIETAKLR